MALRCARCLWTELAVLNHAKTPTIAELSSVKLPTQCRTVRIGRKFDIRKRTFRARMCWRCGSSDKLRPVSPARAQAPNGRLHTAPARP